MQVSYPCVNDVVVRAELALARREEPAFELVDEGAVHHVAPHVLALHAEELADLGDGVHRADVVVAGAD